MAPSIEVGIELSSVKIVRRIIELLLRFLKPYERQSHVHVPYYAHHCVVSEY